MTLQTFTMTIAGRAASSADSLTLSDPANCTDFARAPDCSRAQLDEARALAVTVWVNEIHTIAPHKPMAGHKQSGIGVEFGLDGLREFTQPRLISMSRNPGAAA